jgi:hemerythrin-like metal-binding protein
VAFIQWNSNLSVNVAAIDGQHQRLIALINALNDAMALGKGKEVLSKIINELVNYATSHFALEEKYFDYYKYPEAVAHKKEHADFVKKVGEFQNKFNGGMAGLTLEVMVFLKDWLVKHIQGTDKKYSAFFNAKGLN